jgi:hypothetical protein
MEIVLNDEKVFLAVIENEATKVDGGILVDGALFYTASYTIIEVESIEGARPLSSKYINGGFVEIPDEPFVLSYAHKRRAEYPAIQDQLDTIYWDKVNGTENWKAAIEAIKAKYPKPE